MEIPVLMSSPEVQEHPRPPILKITHSTRNSPTTLGTRDQNHPWAHILRRTHSPGTSPYNIRHKRPEPPLGSHP